MKANYFKVGLFVVVAIAMITIAVIILGAGILEKNEILFETYFDESISGLSIGSPVEIRGVHIGKVEQIGFAGREYEITHEQRSRSSAGHFVRVVFSVQTIEEQDRSEEQQIAAWQARVTRGLRLRLASNILTGQAYIEGAYVDPNRYPIPEFPWKPKFPFVPSAPSELTTLKDSVDQILQRLQELDLDNLAKTIEQTFVSIDKAVTDANVAQVSNDIRGLLNETTLKIQQLDTEQINSTIQKVLASADQAITDANLPAVSAEAQSLLAEARRTNQGLQKLLLAPETQTAQSNLPEMVTRLNTTLSRIDKLIATEKPTIELILQNFALISENLKDLTETLKQNPAGLLRSTPPKQSEALK